jgi:hypothetical protein
MKKLLSGLLFLAAALGAAQTTTVTATVVDPDGTPWANGTCSALYAPIPGSPGQLTNSSDGSAITVNPVPCTMNGSGVLSLVLVQSK